MPQYFVTTDGHLIVIDKGGEQLANNTYGFEIEFCTHDNQVFAFTHVDVADLPIVVEGLGKVDWKIETDSGNVLELVTSPIHFASAIEAYAHKVELANKLADSVFLQQVDRDTINALPLGQWRQLVVSQLGPVISACYGNRTIQAGLTLKSWADVGPQINVQNIDDGINVKAALLRYYINRDGLWVPYVDSTVLCRSEKDWGQRYSSQVNMPMTLAGYFLYVVKRKLPRSDARLDQIVQVNDLDTLSDTTLYQRVTTWFWSNIIASAACYYASGLFERKIDVRDLDVQQMNMLQLKAAALSYVTANKVLTGALGSLSEENQLRLQQVAWREQSTQGMVEDKPSSYSALLRSEGVTTTAWLEYHSSMKDLTGLWFKAALMDVVYKEQLGAVVYRNMGNVLRNQGGSGWKAVLEHYINVMKSKKWDRLWRKREGYADDLEDLNWTQLLEAIITVERELAHQFWLVAEEFADATPEAPPTFELPDRSDRPFLGYGSAPPWEGRYDTMVKSIQRPDGQWTYLIEHRFN